MKMPVGTLLYRALTSLCSSSSCHEREAQALSFDAGQQLGLGVQVRNLGRILLGAPAHSVAKASATVPTLNDDRRVISPSAQLQELDPPMFQGEVVR